MFSEFEDAGFKSFCLLEKNVVILLEDLKMGCVCHVSTVLRRELSSRGLQMPRRGW